MGIIKSTLYTEYPLKYFLCFFWDTIHDFFVSDAKGTFQSDRTTE